VLRVSGRPQEVAGRECPAASVVDARLEALLGAASGPVNWRSSSRTTGPGFLRARSATDAHSQLAYSEALNDEAAAIALAFWTCAHRSVAQPASPSSDS
jgi:hypothetical protein